MYQDKPGIYVYDMAYNEVMRFVYYPTMRDFLNKTSEHHIKTYVVTEVFLHDKVTYTATGLSQYRCERSFMNYNIMVCDDTGKNYKSDLLVGLYRKNRKEQIENYYKTNINYYRPLSKKAWAGYRHPKTTNERRQSFNIDKEYDVKCRARRNACNLVHTYDDVYTHNDKSWKTQSKRKNQYKV